MDRPQLRVGIDVMRISRFAQLAQERAFLKRAFHPSELRDARPEHLAGIFATKEAFFKALGSPPRWLQVEVTKQSDGKPFLNTAAELQLNGLLALDVSIAHEDDYVAAVAVMLFEMEQGP